MTIKKKLLAVAAAGALTAATALPALAFENEFHGMYRFKGDVTNVQNAGPAPYYTSPTSPNNNDPQTRVFMEQRARLMYIGKASDDLKLVTHFELDYSKFGDNSYNVGRNNGAALGADQINLETKSIYLDFNTPGSVPINFKVGMQPWVDSYGGLFVNADMAGILASAKYAGFTNSLGWFRWDDKGSIAGKNARNFLVLDTKYALNKDLRLGASYYMVDNNLGAIPSTDPESVAATSIVHSLGLNAQYKYEKMVFDAGGIYQFGNMEAPVNTHLTAGAFFAGGKLGFDAGTVNLGGVYTTGDSNAKKNSTTSFQSTNNTTSGAYSENTFYQSNMQILMRSKYEINSGRYIIYTANNLNQGMMVFYGGWDGKIDKFYYSANLGCGWVASRNTKSESTSKYLGTEVNGEIGYKLFDNMSASLYGGWVSLGDYFKGSNGAVKGKLPDTPYITTAMLNYTF